MEKDTLNLIQNNLKKIYDTLKQNNSKDSIFIFLNQFLFFLYLGSTKIIKNFKSIINMIIKIQDPKELESFFMSLFSSLGQRKENSSYFGEPFSNSNDMLCFNSSFIRILKESRLLNLDYSSLTALEFCNIFESLLETSDKHESGMYFTSKENIEKAIKPLFLDSLEEELNYLIKNNKQEELKEFLEKLSNLTFLDPACGVGNFLVVTFNQLKRLENKCIKFSKKSLSSLISINQFYGIEINPAITIIARTALKIAGLDYKADLKNNLITANALRFDWNNLIPASQLDYIIGNPPFLGARVMEKNQKEDLKIVFESNWDHLGDLDYVSGWFKKAFDYIKTSSVKAALVATSSISEGLSAHILFAPLIRDGFIIDFAYQSFLWSPNESNKANVYVVIVGFSSSNNGSKKILFTDEGIQEVDHINGYLIGGPEVYALSRITPISDVPEMGIGNKPVDGGNYLFSQEKYEEFIALEPESKKFFRPFYGSKEFIYRQPRYCLYLKDVDEKEYKDLKQVKKQIEKVRNFRLASKSPGTRKIAETPTKFHVTNDPKTSFLAIPRVSSPNREYIPIGFMDKKVLASDSMLIIPDSNLYHFGVLTSKLHMIWLNFVCGRFGKAIRYSKHIVYNNFPWPEPSEEEKETIIETGKNILKVREKYKNENLKTLYTSGKMPKDLKKVHEENDQAVLKAYHFKENEDLIHLLFDRYSLLINQ